ncbi:MAG: alkane 1-monooxygenase [Mesorhizobium sp.]|nr:alkane 1-monooxygenase [Mesorhizobium sp.]
MSITSSGSEGVLWRHDKRWLWLLSVLTPAMPAVGAAMLLSGGNLLWSWYSLFYGYVALTVLDLWFGEDPFNPPSDAIEELAGDPWYRRLLFAALPVYGLSLAVSIIAVGTMDLPLWAFLGVALGAGAMSGVALVVGHELGHKPAWSDQLGGKLACALSGYAHFCMEHNRGHHVQVATPEDPASARYGESLYRFALREVPGAFARGWRLERARLEKKRLPFWHWRNDLLQGYALHFAIIAVSVGAFGWPMIAFFVIHDSFAWFQLTMANYVEHYGLLRQKRADGRYEPCEPRHSWNTNHIVSNLTLFHLQRHSDHHANPLRPYQALRNFEELPRLPSGYPGAFLLASVPPLWFKVMNPKALAWAGGDMSKLNRGAQPAG